MRLLLLTCLALAVASSSATEGSRQERSIRDWFSNFMKRFQRSDRSQPPYYLRSRQNSYYPSYPSYSPQHSYQSVSFQSRPQSFSHSSFSGNQNFHGGNVGGHSGGGHGSLHDSHTSHGSHNSQGSQGSHDVHAHSHGHGGKDHGSNIKGDFGPLKGSDVVNFNSGNSIHDLSSHGGKQQAVHKVNSVSLQGKDHGSSIKAASTGGESYVPTPHQSGNDFLNEISLQGKELPLFLDTNEEYQQTSSASNFQPNVYVSPSGSHPTTLVVGGSAGENAYIPQIGHQDPYIEIVFQDGEPLPPLPPPVIDESHFEPISDDVEVFFVEFSPYDNYEDIENLDLSGAQPAILQDLPNELPYELRRHLLNSGVLDNAQIEIIDLNTALHDPSLDANTRSALQQAYRRPHRDVQPNPKENRADTKAEPKVKVQRVSHGSKSPEDNVLPPNRELDGVLVLAPASKRQTRRPKSTFGKSNGLRTSASDARPVVVSRKQRRLLDIDWADMDSNGWIPIVDVDT